MARRRFGRTRTRTVFRNARSRVRRPRKNDFKKYGKKIALGTIAGLAISVPLTVLGRRMNQPIMIEAGQRIGSVTASYVGGPVGVAGYQTADALFDRFLVGNGGAPSFSGSQGQVYM